MDPGSQSAPLVPTNTTLSLLHIHYYYTFPTPTSSSTPPNTTNTTSTTYTTTYTFPTTTSESWLTICYTCPNWVLGLQLTVLRLGQGGSWLPRYQGVGKKGAMNVIHCWMFLPSSGQVCVAGDVEIREMTTLMSDPNRLLQAACIYWQVLPCLILTGCCMYLLTTAAIDPLKRGIVSSDAANIQLKRLRHRQNKQLWQLEN